MKSRIIISILIVFLSVSYATATGISPARATYDITEYNCSFNSNINYALIRPGTRYSSFSVTEHSGLVGTITGCSVSDGVEYLEDGSMIIDWQSSELSSLSSITTTMNFQSPQLWDCPVEPGGSLITELVRHSDMVDIDSGIGAAISAVSQIAFYRNYAPRIYLRNSANNGLSSNIALQLEDKHEVWWARDPEFAWLRYEIDWDSDGVIDQSGNTTLDDQPVLDSSGIYRWTSGIQISTLDLEHTYEFAGNYTATISVTDLGYVSGETTVFQIPIEVVPEPATLALFGLGSLILRKKLS